jgi:acyl-CoA thioesterase YciA
MTDKHSKNQDNAENNGKKIGDLVLRTIAMPKDTNFNGDIFGGWLLSQMDLGGCVAARKISKSRVTTIAVDKMVFENAVHVGDTVCCYARHIKTGKTSMQFEMTVNIVREGIYEHKEVTKAIFTYVAIDDCGKPIPVDR